MLDEESAGFTPIVHLSNPGGLSPAASGDDSEGRGGDGCVDAPSPTRSGDRRTPVPGCGSLRVPPGEPTQDVRRRCRCVESPADRRLCFQLSAVNQTLQLTH